MKALAKIFFCENVITKNETILIENTNSDKRMSLNLTSESDNFLGDCVVFDKDKNVD